MTHLLRRSLTALAVAALGGALLAPVQSATASPASRAVVPVRAAAVPAATVGVSLSRVVSGLDQPLLVRSAPDGTSRLFVVEKTGRVRVVVGGRIIGTFIDVRRLVRSQGEQGLLGLAFPPNFATSHVVFITYTRADGALVLDRFSVRRTTSASVLGSSRRTVLVVPHPTNTNHNGGDIAFGPDKYLYLGTGDGGSSGDPRRNAQNLRSLSGKMLRIDALSRTRIYSIPRTNPYATSRTARHEIWMSGLRNPWRWSFDGTTQYIGDVGQNRYEEIDAVTAARARGADLGWSCREGFHSFATSHCIRGRRLVGPTLELCHPDGVSGCPSSRAGEAIIGGYVYRGTATPGAQGTYVFGDYVAGRIWLYRGRTLSAPLPLADVSGFGLDDNKEMYATTLSGGLYRLGFTAA
jgi:hypothetical protein